MRLAHGLQWLAVLTLLLPAPVLGQNPSAKLDLDGDELPVGAIARCGTSRYRHGGPISCVTYSPDGTSIASIGQDGVRLFNAVDGKQVHFWPGPAAGFEGRVEFAPDGRSLFSANFFSLCELDVMTGKEVRKLIDQTALVHSFAVSPDGKKIAVANDDEVHLIERQSGRTVRKLSGHKGQVNAVAWSRDGLTLASGGDDHFLRYWDAPSGKEKKKTDVGLTIQSLTYSPDGAMIALTRTKNSITSGIRLVDSTTGEKLRDFTSWFSWISPGTDFSPDGKTLAVCIGDTIYSYDTHDGTVASQFECQQQDVDTLRFSPDGRSLVTAGHQSAIHIFDVKSGKCRTPNPGHASIVAAVAVMPNGKTLATGGNDKSIRFWDIATGAPSLPRIETQGPVHALRAGEGDFVSVISDDLAKSDVRADKLSRRMPTLFEGGAFSANGKFAVGVSLESQFSVFETVGNKQLVQFGSKGFRSIDWRALAISNDGKLLADGSLDLGALMADSRIRIWDIDQHKIVHELTGHRRRVGALEFTPSGRELISAGDDGRIHFWNPAAGKSITEWTAPNDEPITALAVSTDGRTIASGSENGTVRTWERLTGQIRRTLPGHLGEVHALRFSADGRLLVSGSADSTALIWRMSADDSEKPATAPILDSLWNDLQSNDAAVAERAIWRLAPADAATIAALEARLPRVPAADGERIKALIADLNSDKFATRQKAEADLAKLGAIAQPALQAALDGKLSSEQRDRIKALLARLEAIPTGETLGALRAVEALEHNGSADARHVLATLAAGSAGPRVAESAKESLERMGAKAEGK
jgi:WD40 repeat protein